MSKESKQAQKKEGLRRRHNRVRAKIIGTSNRPRLCVYRANNHIYAQLIDDDNNKTILAISDRELVSGKTKTVKPMEVAKLVGKLTAEKALKAKIDTVVFDRGGYKYHGRVKALAEGAREGGLKF